MQLNSNQREKLLEDLKNTIKEANKLKPYVEGKIVNGTMFNNEVKERLYIDLHLLTLKIGIIESMLISNEIES